APDRLPRLPHAEGRLRPGHPVHRPLGPRPATRRNRGAVPLESSRDRGGSAPSPVTDPVRPSNPSPGSDAMNRRQFLQSGTAGLALPAAGAHLAWAAPVTKPRRVGLIGSGWYGKADLLRLIQVEPVEVVSLCDVDKKMLAEAAEIVASRQASKKA